MNKERPIISGLIKKGTSEKECFQNEVVRPIIKMQHQLLIVSFQSYIEKRKIDFSRLDKEKINSQIETICKKDTAFKSLILGLVIGHFTIKEYEKYRMYSSEYNKRIIQIVKKRLQDSITELL